MTKGKIMLAEKQTQTLLELQLEHMPNMRGRMLARLKYEALQAGRDKHLIALEVGDFTEYFGAQAKAVAAALDLTLTVRHAASGSGRVMAMCGYPYHAAETYRQQLVAQGYTLQVVTAEQLEELASAVLKTEERL